MPKRRQSRSGPRTPAAWMTALVLLAGCRARPPEGPGAAAPEAPRAAAPDSAGPPPAATATDAAAPGTSAAEGGADRAAGRAPDVAVTWGALRFDPEQVSVWCACLAAPPPVRMPDDAAHAGSFVHWPAGTAVEGGGAPARTATAVPTAGQLARLADLVRVRGVLDLPEPESAPLPEPGHGMDGGLPQRSTLTVRLDGRTRTLSWHSAAQWPDTPDRERLFTFLGELRGLADLVACKPACAAAGRLEEPVRLADPAAAATAPPPDARE